MKKLPIVAIIGQTNAGKSSLFNRLARQKTAIVAREAGTTRDNVMTRIKDSYVLIDTAGLKDPEDDFEASIQTQIDEAIDAADLILLTLDGTKYTDHNDKNIARKTLKSGKPVILVLNKTDLGGSLGLDEFRNLGIKNVVKTSATTGQGINELEDTIFDNIEDVYEPEQDKNALKIALIGRPNVGKSSLFNSMAEKQQAIVASISGTTRDINRAEIRYKGKDLEILDTAGLRKQGKREVGVEKFSALRTLAAIEEADICCLLIDSTESHAKLDQALAGQIIDAGKGIILIVTKTDLEGKEGDEILNQLEEDFNFIPYAPVILTSSVSGKNVTKIFELALKIDAERRMTIKTSELNKILTDAVLAHTPAGLKNTMPKLRYITQSDTCPPWFIVYGSNLGLLHWSYKRFLERKIREQFPFTGTPIFFSFRNRD
ncbi:MAG: ribosome biogenesis GTPase Der [Candidatus Nomurabacteria bacterium]|jgi:GTP-binding protein|nr:ribosome biogenesis GTPase Der [Candidatus Nomurabacteria bacterium]